MTSLLVLFALLLLALFFFALLAFLLVAAACATSIALAVGVFAAEVYVGGVLVENYRFAETLAATAAIA